MYLTSGLFPSADIAFIAYVSLNFVLGLCTLLMTTMPRLLAIVTRAQVSAADVTKPSHLPQAPPPMSSRGQGLPRWLLGPHTLSP